MQLICKKPAALDYRNEIPQIAKPVMEIVNVCRPYFRRCSAGQLSRSLILTHLNGRKHVCLCKSSLATQFKIPQDQVFPFQALNTSLFDDMISLGRKPTRLSLYKELCQDLLKNTILEAEQLS